MAPIAPQGLRWTPAQLALAACLVFVVLLGGSEAGRLVTPIRAVAAGVGGVVIGAYLLNAPRRHDLVDGLVLAALLAFLVTCVTSMSPRLSFEAATTATAYVAAFYLARGVVATPAGRDLAILIFGLLGTVIAVIFLVAWGTVWIRWISTPGAGFPPFTLMLPSAQFSVIRATMAVALLLPAVILLCRRQGIWPLGVIGVAASLAVIVMGGSRSVWLGGLVALVVGGVLGWQSVRRVPKYLVFAALAGVIATVAAVSPQLLARIAAGGTVELRVAIWGEALASWLQSPLVGHGPGNFASGFALTGFYNIHDAYVPYAHNVLVQVVFDAGLLGLLALGLLGSALTVGIRRGVFEGASVSAIALFITTSLTEDPTQVAFLVVPLLIWVALLCPRSRSDPASSPDSRLRTVTFALGGVVAVAVAATLAASWSYDRARQAAESGDHPEVVQQLTVATKLDPAFPLYHRDLGVWMLMRGNSTAATAELERAVDLNPADQAALRALAVGRLESRDPAGSLAVARVAADRADLHVENSLTLAYVGMRTGDLDVAHAAMTRAVRLAPWLLAAPEWDDVFWDTPKGDILDAARRSWDGSATVSHRNVRARSWLLAFSGLLAPADAGLALEAEAALIDCQPYLARHALAQLSREAALGSDAMQAQLMVARGLGEPVAQELATLLTLRNPGLARQAYGGVAGDSPLADYTNDVQVYGRVPIPPRFGPTLPSQASGLGAWLGDPVTAADKGAPGSALAECR